MVDHRRSSLARILVKEIPLPTLFGTLLKKWAPGVGGD